MIKKPIIFLLILLITAQIVSAASIHGSVYTFSLEKVRNVIVEINTSPMQRQIAENSSYSFNVPNGNYIILAKTVESKLLATENITINDNGDYTLDLIAFIDLEEELENDIADIDITTEIEDIEENKNYIWGILTILIILIISLYLLRYKKIKSGNKKAQDATEDDLTNKVLEIIKKEGGRTTQKQIRKLLPYSEAKISLVITELESKNKIKKIRKGRSNIIILN